MLDKLDLFVFVMVGLWFPCSKIHRSVIVSPITWLVCLFVFFFSYF